MMTRKPPHRDRPGIRYELERKPRWEYMPAVELDADGLRIVGTWPALTPDEAEALGHLLLSLCGRQLVVRSTAGDLAELAREVLL